jgi:hypothetical protein
MAENYKTNLASFCGRALEEARQLASQLVTDDGKLIREGLKLKNDLYLEGFSDDTIRARQEKFLTRWASDNSFFNSFKKFSLPLCHKGAEKLIRNSLQLPPKGALTDVHIKRAVISACLMILRQTVGSCFATAPAILIQEEYIDLFLQDLYDLLTQGKLKRVIRGREYSVPLGLSLDDKENHALLKAWEFTLASLSEAGRDFPRWNLYLSLGLDPQEKGGVGEVLYQFLEDKLQEANQKVREQHLEAQNALDQCKLAESLLKQSSNEPEMRRLQAEYTARYHHFQSTCDLREHYQNLAQTISHLFSALIQKYAEKIQEYFQEIYDPEMADISHHQYEAQYEDRPAGFRLVYKHGRSDASLWTQINSSDEFIKSLVDFFTLTEGQFIHEYETEEEKRVIVDATSAVIRHVRSDEFLQRALERTQKEKRTPWSYVSGGTMDVLLTLYFRRENSLKQESKWVESPLELLTFLIDTIKNLPHFITDPFLKNPQKRVLMQSPKHAFSLLPGQELFKRGWQDTTFTYTWVRDHFLIPMQNFYARMLFSPYEQETLISKAGLSFTAHGTVQIAELYQILMEKHVPNPASFLYRSLPLIKKEECKAALQDLLHTWTKKVELPENLPLYLTSEELCTLAKLNLAKQGFSHLDIHLLVIEKARDLNLAPTPCLFADTNWTESYFAFVVNPGTQELELWKTDRTGCMGYPMTSWNSWLNGTEKLPWVVYTDV